MKHARLNVRSGKTIGFFHVLFFFLALLAFALYLRAQSPSPGKTREYIVIKVYHATDPAQLETVDQYLQSSLVPALGKGGFARTGVFTSIDNDTAKDKRMYVIVALSSLPELERMNAITERAGGDSLSSRGYTAAAYNVPPFTRIETILLRAFEGASQLMFSGLKGPQADRVYELRSYESATEALHQNKVKMFNSGEIDLFKRLGFNAVFYGQVIAGSQMPNLMYMTSFDNKAARDEHWKTFGADPEWKAMSAKPEYQHNTSKNTSYFLQPTAYSKL